MTEDHAAQLGATLERFPVFEGMRWCRHAFVGRAPGINVAVDRQTALDRLDGFHWQARDFLGLSEMPFAKAEQVHGCEIAVLREGEELSAMPVAGADALVTNRRDLCLGIYVADCCAVYLADPATRAIGLVHAGKKGAELGIVPAAIAMMTREFGVAPASLAVQLSPCIRPPWYEVDFAAEIVRQARDAGVGKVEDCGTCTATDPQRYYSYRREKGRTGRMLALLAAASPDPSDL